MNISPIFASFLPDCSRTIPFSVLLVLLSEVYHQVIFQCTHTCFAEAYCTIPTSVLFAFLWEPFVFSRPCQVDVKELYHGHHLDIMENIISSFFQDLDEHNHLPILQLLPMQRGVVIFTHTHTHTHAHTHAQASHHAWAMQSVV